MMLCCAVQALQCLALLCYQTLWHGIIGCPKMFWPMLCYCAVLCCAALCCAVLRWALLGTFGGACVILSTCVYLSCAHRKLVSVSEQWLTTMCCCHNFCYIATPGLFCAGCVQQCIAEMGPHHHCSGRQAHHLWRVRQHLLAV